MNQKLLEVRKEKFNLSINKLDEEYFAVDFNSKSLGKNLLVTKNFEEAKNRFDTEIFLLEYQTMENEDLYQLFDEMNYERLNSIYGSGLEKVMILETSIIGRTKDIVMYLKNEIDCLPKKTNLYWKEKIENRNYYKRCQDLIDRLRNFSPNKPLGIISDTKEFIILSDVALKNQFETMRRCIESNNIDKLKDEFEKIAKDYDFKVKDNTKEVSLCARNTDGEWRKWITYDVRENKFLTAGNTDECNFWFCDTRKDMNPEKILNFVADLNTILRKFGTYIKLSSLIDSEDWQKIANVKDAYEDDRYQIQLKSIEFGTDNYIYFTIFYKERESDGLFRIHDLDNGPDMTLVSIGNSVTEEKQNFLNAHWEEIENELCNYAKQRQNNIEEGEER